jgi:crotonobetaine/carnitine-CoA ligase
VLTDTYGPADASYRSLLEAPHAWASAAPDRVLLTEVGGERWTRAETLSEVAGVQAWLASIGVQPGQRVAILCVNSVRMVAAYLAIIGIGAHAVPINAGMRGDVLTYILRHSDVVAAIADHDLAPRLVESEASALSRDRVLLTSDRGDFPTWGPRMPLGRLVMEEAAGDVAQVIYTSGTTSRPKGVLLGPQAILTSAGACARLIHGADEDMVLYTSMPLFHCGAQQVSLWSALISGAQLVIAPRFSASTFWQQMREHGVNHFNFIGQMLSILYAAPESATDRDHSVTAAVGGGPKTAWTEFEQRFGLRIVEMYGMSETFSGCVSQRFDSGKAGTAGQPLPHVGIRILDRDGAIQPDGTVGEIQLRPSQRDFFFTGYLDDPVADREAWDGEWFRTGDAGYVDEDGDLVYQERLNGIIRHKGENISAAAVEAEVVRMPGVLEAAALAVPSDLGEDDLLVAVVADDRVTVEALREYCERVLPTFAVPAHVIILEQFPKTATMRVQKHLIRDEFQRSRQAA